MEKRVKRLQFADGKVLASLFQVVLKESTQEVNNLQVSKDSEHYVIGFTYLISELKKQFPFLSLLFLGRRVKLIKVV